MVLDLATAANPLQKRLVQISDGLAKNNIPFTVAKRYYSLTYVGDGSYGVVVSARDALAELDPSLALDTCVAIKRVHNAFTSVYDMKHLLREVRLLAALDHPNILRLRDIELPNSFSSWVDVYLVTPLLPHTLSKRLEKYAAKHPGQPLPDDTIRKVLVGMCRALKYMRSANVVHRDIKTGNVLLRDDWTPVLCDLGLARSIDPDDENTNLTEKVVTRVYRAPELFITPSAYTSALDMWSLGCILHELLCPGSPLFVKRKAHFNQLDTIFQVLGTPSEEALAEEYRDEATIAFIRRMRHVKAKPMAQRFSTLSDYTALNPQAVDLLNRLLVLDPSGRMSPEEVLRHPFLDGSSKPVDEPTVSIDRCLEIASLEPALKPTKDDIRRALWAEVTQYHPREAAAMVRNGTGPPPTTRRSADMARPGKAFHRKHRQSFMSRLSRRFSGRSSKSRESE